MSKFFKLLRKTEKEEAIAGQLCIGQRFPYDFDYHSTKPHLLLFLSLNCLKCIDLLPYIEKVQEKFTGNITVFTNGTEKENEEIINFFNFNIPFLSIEDDHYQKYGVFTKPFFYIVNSYGKIIHKDSAEDINQVLDACAKFCESIYERR